MKLKQITWLFFTLFMVVALNSCNTATEEYTVTAPSADAQIYSFKLKATPSTAADSVSFPVLATTKFVIVQDQSNSVIYNPDSLPYKTKLKKFAATITYGTASPSKVQLVYPKDSIVDWNSTDSIDFSTPKYPKIRVTPANGDLKYAKDYTIEIRVHKVDPDLLVWKEMTAQPNTVGKQKTLLKDNKFHTFSVEASGLYLYNADKTQSPLVWNRTLTSGISASNLVLESITLFNGKFYAVDTAENSYSSADGITWSQESANVYSILGVLPEVSAAKDSLLVVVDQAGKYLFAKTVDMQTLVVSKNVSGSLQTNQIPSDFPALGFSSAVAYNRINTNSNILSLTGGKDFTGKQTNTTWSIHSGDNKLEVASNKNNTPIFAINSGISSFAYDGYLYALTKNMLYKTTSFGYKWVLAPDKEQVSPIMSRASGQSVVVDSDNNIWVFGGILDSGLTPVTKVWKGRINRLNP